MKFRIEKETPVNTHASCLVIPVFEDNQLSPAAQSLEDASQGSLSKILETGDLGSDLSSTLLLHHLPNIKTPRILLVHAGETAGMDNSGFIKFVKSIAQSIKSLKISDSHLFLDGITVKQHDANWIGQQLASQFESVFYRFDECKSKSDKDQDSQKGIEEIIVHTSTDIEDLLLQGLTKGSAIAEGQTLCKNLGNRPGNICTPTQIADEAEEMGKNHPKLEVSVIDESEMEQLGMGALLSVSRGSEQPAKLIVMKHLNGAQDDAPYLFVGKGITFDTGGISIKPGPAMDEMKYDMCGAASVIGLMKTVSLLDLPLNIVGILTCAENMPSGVATKPGDIVTTYSGKTVEILNTDAEGRLVLCDALSYGLEKFNPQITVDIATLTGACVMALGSHVSGLFSQDDELAEELLQAGTYGHDRAWRLPLWDEYQEQLDSNFADMANIGSRMAGATTAACFLSRFTTGFRWAHIDIAGTAWNQGKNKGATGRPIQLLTQFLLNRASQ